MKKIITTENIIIFCDKYDMKILKIQFFFFFLVIVNKHAKFSDCKKMLSKWLLTHVKKKLYDLIT